MHRGRGGDGSTGADKMLESGRAGGEGERVIVRVLASVGGVVVITGGDIQGNGGGVGACGAMAGMR